MSARLGALSTYRKYIYINALNGTCKPSNSVVELIFIGKKPETFDTEVKNSVSESPQHVSFLFSGLAASTRWRPVQLALAVTAKVNSHSVWFLAGGQWSGD